MAEEKTVPEKMKDLYRNFSAKQNRQQMKNFTAQIK